MAYCIAGPPVEHIREVAECLKRIGDELDGDENLQRSIIHCIDSIVALIVENLCCYDFFPGLSMGSRLTVPNKHSWKLRGRFLPMEISTGEELWPCSTLLTKWL